MIWIKFLVCIKILAKILAQFIQLDENYEKNSLEFTKVPASAFQNSPEFSSIAIVLFIIPTNILFVFYPFCPEKQSHEIGHSVESKLMQTDMKHATSFSVISVILGK